MYIIGVLRTRRQEADFNCNCLREQRSAAAPLLACKAPWASEVSSPSRSAYGSGFLQTLMLLGYSARLAAIFSIGWLPCLANSKTQTKVYFGSKKVF